MAQRQNQKSFEPFICSPVPSKTEGWQFFTICTDKDDRYWNTPGYVWKVTFILACDSKWMALVPDVKLYNQHTKGKAYNWLLGARMKHPRWFFKEVVKGVQWTLFTDGAEDQNHCQQSFASMHIFTDNKSWLHLLNQILQLIVQQILEILKQWFTFNGRSFQNVLTADYQIANSI